MARYIKRYLICFISVLISLSVIIYFFHAYNTVSFNKNFFINFYQIFLANFNFIFFSSVFLTVFYFFQTKEFVFFKTVLLSLIIVSVINFAFISAYFIKPRKSDDKSYHFISSELQYFLKISSKRNSFYKDDILINYDSFDEYKGIFTGLSIINIKNNAIFSAHSGIITKSNNTYHLNIHPVYDINGNRVQPIKIQILTDILKSPFIQKCLNLYLKVRNDLTFYPKIIEKSSLKKNIYFYINLFFTVFGLTAVFMFFGLISSIPSKRIVNISISFSLVPICYLAIHYIYKIPINKINFLNKGFLSRVNVGIIMLVLALILSMIAIFKVKSNSRREA